MSKFDAESISGDAGAIYRELGKFGARGDYYVRKEIPLLRKLFRLQKHLPGSKFDAECISGHAGATYCDLVNLERGVTVTFEIMNPVITELLSASKTSSWVEVGW